MVNLGRRGVVGKKKMYMREEMSTFQTFNQNRESSGPDRKDLDREKVPSGIKLTSWEKFPCPLFRLSPSPLD